MRRSPTSSLLRSALVAALVAVGAFVAVPIGPVPVTLQVLVIAVAVLVLTPAEAFAALALYLAVGALGMPVFSGGGGGPGVLLGPTGGFLFGFALGAPAGALVRTALARTRARALADVSALAILLALSYLLGWLQFSVWSGRGAAEAFRLAVAPFLLVDVVKSGVALLVARGVRAAGLAPPDALGPGHRS